MRERRLHPEPPLARPKPLKLSWGRDLKYVECWPLAERMRRAQPRRSAGWPGLLRQWVKKLLSYA